jgi:sugar lactone lactonase YvrE
MKNIKYFLLIFTVFACNSGKNKSDDRLSMKSDKDGHPSKIKLELVWSSDTLLRTPESVLFDAERKVLYISNVNLNPWEKDGNGFVTKMDLSGNIIELKWIEGLSSPTGMGISKGFLYIADTDEIVQADIETGEITRRYDIEGKPNLNDITVGDDGVVYITGSASNIIYALKDNDISEFLVGEDESFNGLFWEKDRLLLLSSASGQLKEIDWDTKETNILAENLEGSDGIVYIGDGAYLTSRWAGAIFHVSREGTVTKLLDTESDGKNTADFDYSPDDNLLFVPTFFDNRVEAYKLLKY